MITKIFLDLDDTLNQLTMPTLYMKGCQGDYPTEVGYDIIAAYWKMLDFRFGINEYPDEEDFFDYVDWACLPKSAEFEKILKLSLSVISKNDIYVLSRVISGTADSKIKWIEENLPGFKYILCSDNKDFCASKDSLLIDDNEHNIDSFTKSGGLGILVPRPWNRLHDIENAAGFIDTCFTFLRFM